MNNLRIFVMIVGCIVVYCFSSSYAEPSQQINSIDVNGITKSRHKRWLPRFPFNSCYALAVVLALPLELKGRNVFFSYNFETNYYFPYFDNVQGIVPIPFATIDQEGTNLGTLITNNTPLDQVRSLTDETTSTEGNMPNSENSLSLKTNSTLGIPDEITSSSEPSQSDNKVLSNVKEMLSVDKSMEKDLKTDSTTTVRRKSRAILEHLMTRARLYKMIESKMNSHGMNGRKCLQKAICDTSANPVSEHNGLIGDIVHIIFTPSTSKDERLPRDLSEAELRGKSNNCATYAKLCPTSVLDLITTYM